MYKINDKAIAFLPIETIEPEAMIQILNISEMPFIHKHVAVMPDCHCGKGATVGTVIATKGAIIPAAVGVDIGCGMIAVKTKLKKEELGDLSKILHSIERSIPMSAGKFNNIITTSARNRIEELESIADVSAVEGEHYDKFSKNWRESLGTLGGGNHFIEVCLDETDTVWVTLHSGSRGVGNKIGNHYIGVAQKLCDSMFVTLKDKDLAYIPESHAEFHNYLRDLRWAQKFALLNREEMMDRVLKDISYAVYNEDGHQKDFEVERINCHHNFTQIERHMGADVWVTRKGAIQAKVGMKGMIPGSMGTRSYIVSGLENPVAFHSAPHGAGRRFSRTKAREQFTMKDFDKAMKGIEHRRTDILLDEIPGAYKDIDEVMENAKTLVTIEHTLKQIINVKGD
jgi:tRNA-splicing ligase RtcB (3'-phosphate/5'-hydroxy nucleic acid ligase)